MLIQAASVVTLLLLCLSVCWSDITQRRIANMLSFLILLVCGIGFETSLQLDSLLLILLCGLIVGKLNLIAYGDIKLATAFSIAIPIENLSLALISTTLFGGILAVIYLIKYRLILAIPRGQDPGLPYGVAICAGFLLTIMLLQ